MEKAYHLATILGASVSIIAAICSIVIYFKTRREKKEVAKIVREFHEEGSKLYKLKNEELEKAENFKTATEELWSRLNSISRRDYGIDELKSDGGDEIRGIKIEDLLQELENRNKIKNRGSDDAPRFWQFTIQK